MRPSDRFFKDFQLTSYSICRLEALVGKICRDTESDPPNPNWHNHVLNRHMPAEEETNRMAESYQRKHSRGDQGKNSLAIVRQSQHR
jgi:hypothetical protein